MQSAQNRETWKRENLIFFCLVSPSNRYIVVIYGKNMSKASDESIVSKCDESIVSKCKPW